MKRTATLILVALCVGLASCSRDPNVRKQKYLDSGKHYYEQAKYSEAVIQFSNAIQIDPRFAQAHYQLAQTFLKLGAYSPAYQELLRTVDLQPDNDSAQIDLGSLLLGSLQLEEAAQRAQIVLSRHPANPDAHALMANIYGASAKTDVALQEIHKAIELDPQRAKFQTILGMLLQNGHRYAESETAYKRAIELDPKSSDILLKLADFYIALQRWAEGEQAFQKAVGVDPRSPQPRIALARFYVMQQKQDRAVEVLTDAKKAMADNPEGYRLLGDFYVSNGQFDNALAEYASLFQDHKNDLALKKAYIAMLLQKHQYDEASRLNNEILAKNSKDTEALIAKARILISENKAGDAIPLLETAIKFEPENANAHYGLALSAERTGDTTRSEKELRETVRLRPDFVDAQQALATIALRKQDSETLAGAGEALIAARPTSGAGYVMRGMAKLNRKDPAGGEEDFKKAIQIAPQAAIGYLRLGELRWAQQRYREADQLFEQALDRDPSSGEAVQALTASAIAQKKPLSGVISRINAQIAKAPNTSSFYAILGSIEIQARNFATAEQHLQKALELDRNNAAAFGLLAQAQFANGATDKAVATYKKWIQQNPTDVRPYVMIGMLQDMKSNWQEAQKNYQQALAVSPDFPLAANNLAYSMLEHGGNTDVALSLAQIARRGMLDSPSAADTLAWAYYHKGAYASAIDLLQEAIKKAPANATYEYHLGLAYMKNNQRARARDHFQKALEIDSKSPLADQARKALDELKG